MLANSEKDGRPWTNSTFGGCRRVLHVEMSKNNGGGIVERTHSFTWDIALRWEEGKVSLPSLMMRLRVVP